jgi:hypothetical protein
MKSSILKTILNNRTRLVSYMLYKIILAKANPKLYATKIATPGQNTIFTSIII